MLRGKVWRGKAGERQVGGYGRDRWCCFAEVLGNGKPAVSVAVVGLGWRISSERRGGARLPFAVTRWTCLRTRVTWAGPCACEVARLAISPGMLGFLGAARMSESVCRVWQSRSFGRGHYGYGYVLLSSVWRVSRCNRRRGASRAAIGMGCCHAVGGDGVGGGACSVPVLFGEKF